MLPNTRITTTMVGNELGVSTRSVGQLCTHTNINKWSKYKPVQWPSVSDRNYKAYNGWCGFNGSMMGIGNNPYDHYKAGTAWVYQPPIGGSSSPYRLGDFRGYSHLATPFVMTEIPKGKVLEYNRAVTSELVHIGIKMKTTSSTDIVLSDFDTTNLNWEEARFATTVYSLNPLNIPDGFTYKINTTLYSKLIKDITDNEIISLPIDVYTKLVSRVYVIISIASAFSATSPAHIPIPYDDNNYFMLEYVLVDRPFGDITYGLRNFGFGSSVDSLYQPLAGPDAFYPPGPDKPFKADDRGVFVVTYSIYNYGLYTQTVHLASLTFHAKTSRLKETGRAIRLDGVPISENALFQITTSEVKLLTVEYGTALFFNSTDFNISTDTYPKVTTVTFALGNSIGGGKEDPVGLYLVRIRN